MPTADDIQAIHPSGVLINISDSSAQLAESDTRWSRRVITYTFRSLVLDWFLDYSVPIVNKSYPLKLFLTYV